MFKPGECLYHYTSAATARHFVLPTLKLRMGPFSRVNDPRGAKRWPFKFYARSRNEPFDKRLFSEASRLVTDSSFVLCCSSDQPSANDDPIGMGYAHPRMWAQYADGHKGVCLALDRERLHQAVTESIAPRPLFAGPVRYFNTSHSPPPSDADPYGIVHLEDVAARGLRVVMEQQIQAFSAHFFFTKHQDWRDEWEYRWVCRSEPESSIHVDISEALTAVVLGSDCTTEDRVAIEDVCRPANIAVHQLHWHGWSMSMFDRREPLQPGVSISLNGISFSQRIPCERIWTQACHQDGTICTIAIDSDGSVRYMG